MTRRAKLSLDTDQHHKGAPPHGFDEPQPAASGESARHAGPPAEQAVAGGAAGAARRRAGGRWRAHRPAAEAEAAGGTPGPQNGGQVAAARQRSGSRMPVVGVLMSHAASFARRPLVRAVALGLVAGVSIYLFRRRLF